MAMQHAINTTHDVGTANLTANGINTTVSIVQNEIYSGSDAVTENSCRTMSSILKLDQNLARTTCIKCTCLLHTQLYICGGTGPAW